MTVGFVVIGRNEEPRLGRCLASLPADSSSVVYVDSGSTDRSVEVASQYGAEILHLNLNTPFTAARARNAGLRRLVQIAPEVEYVHFVDADCELVGGWVAEAVAFLRERGAVAVVCGRLRERHPERSVYNWLCDREWDVPPGETQACGGIALMRISALDNVGGFREDLIAGEEPELCLRLRRSGSLVWRLETTMGLHDANILRLGQWWRRAVRSGYAYAQGGQIHNTGAERLWAWETQRALLWGVGLPLACTILTVVLWPVGVVAWLIYPVQMVRQTIRTPGASGDRARAAVFQMLARFAEATGILHYVRDRCLGRRARLIEYK